MKCALAFVAIVVAYTSYCCAYGPPYNDAYGHIIHAAYVMATR